MDECFQLQIQPFGDKKRRNKLFWFISNQKNVGKLDVNTKGWMYSERWKALPPSPQRSTNTSFVLFCWNTLTSSVISLSELCVAEASQVTGMMRGELSALADIIRPPWHVSEACRSAAHAQGRKRTDSCWRAAADHQPDAEGAQLSCLAETAAQSSRIILFLWVDSALPECQVTEVTGTFLWTHTSCFHLSQSRP